MRADPLCIGSSLEELVEKQSHGGSSSEKEGISGAGTGDRIWHKIPRHEFPLFTRNTTVSVREIPANSNVRPLKPLCRRSPYRLKKRGSPPAIRIRSR